MPASPLHPIHTISPKLGCSALLSPACSSSGLLHMTSPCCNSASPCCDLAVTLLHPAPVCCNPAPPDRKLAPSYCNCAHQSCGAAGTLVHNTAHIWGLLELQLSVPGTPAAVPVLPQCLPGHSEGAGLHHLCGEGALVTAAE